MKRIVVLNPIGVVGGAEIVLVRLIDALVEAGWSVQVLCPPGPLAEELEARDIHLHSIPPVTLASGIFPVAAVRTGQATLRAARRLRRAAARADVVLGNGVMSLPTMRVARLDAPTVWYLHDVITRRVHRLVVRFGRRALDLVIAPSDSTAVRVEAAGVPVAVVRNGTVWPVEPVDSDGPPFIVGCAATLTPLKGQDVLLETFADLERDTVLELAGAAAPKDGEYEAELRSRAAAADLAGRVRFLGHVDDPLATMRRWRVAVLPSVRPEAASLAVLEAMSLGLPIVTTDHGGPPEILDGAGLLVPPGDAEALGESIGRLLVDEQLWRRCSAAGRAKVARDLTVDDQRDRLVQLLDSAARGAVQASA